MSYHPTKPPILIEMHRGCGARLIIDLAAEWSSEFREILGLARAWNVAHGSHHKEPAEPLPDPGAAK